MVSKPHLCEFPSTNSNKDKFHTFISYLHDNQKIVDRLCSDLTKSGVNVWSDKNIPAGSRWKNVIRDSIRQGDFFIACFSKEYYERSKTYMKEELTIAIEELRLRTADQAWFIPVKLSECDIPDINIGAGETLLDIQWVELYRDWNAGIEKILDVIKLDISDPLLITNEKDDMVLIPAGEFQMGDNDFSDAKVHTVYLDAFYIDKYEVTNAQYRKFVQATGHKEPEGYGYINGNLQNGFKPWSDPNFKDDDQPVVCVSWEDAKSYADWIGKRLPTEAEWEKAARGGLVGKKYPWGDDITHDDANYSGTGGKDQWELTSPVGSFAPNGYDLYDMAGNVWEWCSDWYGDNYYATSPKSNPTGPSSESSRVLRGGSWGFDVVFLRVADRSDLNPTLIFYFIGFRCSGLR